ncbi:transposase [Fusobacterium necrophorum]|uniref:transposase n=1 Tax=Fusobacterium necrophorum TaxID=859 RepID=UPI0011C22EAF
MVLRKNFTSTPFIIQPHKIVNILENRRTDHLLSFFQGLSMEEYKKVKVVTTHLYIPYLHLIPKVFLNV